MNVGRHGAGERIVLLLADGGINGDGVIGAMEYRLNMGGSKRVGAAIDHRRDINYYLVSR